MITKRLLDRERAPGTRLAALTSVWARLAGAAERHPFLVLRAMRQLVRLNLAPPGAIKASRELLTAAADGLAAYNVRPGGSAPTDNVLRAIAPSFAAAVRAAACERRKVAAQ
jgi:hypothetical protein